MLNTQQEHMFIKPSWRERGVSILAGHFDDEVLNKKLIDCLC